MGVGEGRAKARRLVLKETLFSTHCLVQNMVLLMIRMIKLYLYFTKSNKSTIFTHIKC